MGFASVIAALGRPLSALARQRFLSLLALSVIQVLGCLLPLWFLRFIEIPATGWRLLSIALLGLNLARAWFLVILPTRRLGEGTEVILNPLIGSLTGGIALLGFLCLLINAVGVPFGPNFDLYYAGLLATLLVGFALFADVATGKS